MIMICCVIIFLLFFVLLVKNKEHFSFSDNSDEPVGALSDPNLFPFEVERVESDKWPKTGSVYTICDYQFTFCKEAVNTPVMFYKIDQYYSKGCDMREGELFQIPGYILKYRRAGMYDREYRLNEKIWGSDFLKWNYFRNSVKKMYSFTGLATNRDVKNCGWLYVKDDTKYDNTGKVIEDGNEICCNEQICTGYWIDLVNINNNGNLVIKNDSLVVDKQKLIRNVRLMSDWKYNRGLFLFDIKHLPSSPIANGFIKLEYGDEHSVNVISGQATMCNKLTENVEVPYENGLFACEIESGGVVKLWFFERGTYKYNQLTKITNPNIRDFGEPYVTYNNCQKMFDDTKFRIVIGMNLLSNDSDEHLRESAYWEIGSIKIFQ